MTLEVANFRFQLRLIGASELTEICRYYSLQVRIDVFSDSALGVTSADLGPGRSPNEIGLHP